MTATKPTWKGKYPAPPKYPPVGSKPVSANVHIQKLVALAMGQVGFIEGVNNDNPYGARFGINHQPYCALGVSWLFDQCNLSNLIKGQYNWGFAECSGALAIFKKAGLVLPSNVKAQAGDITFWAWSNPKRAEHVEFVVGNEGIHGIPEVGFNTSADHAMGSQANGGGTHLRHRSRYGIAGVVRVKYPQ